MEASSSIVESKPLQENVTGAATGEGEESRPGKGEAGTKRDLEEKEKPNPADEQYAKI